MTDADIFDIAEKHGAYRDSQTLTLRGHAIVECVREILAIHDKEVNAALDHLEATLEKMK